jgi:uncharacterized protein GlcG (DUF336 family)
LINRVPLARIYQARDLVFEAALTDGRRMAIAVVDEAAGLIFAERMEECDARVIVHASRKAYTAAVMKRSTVFFRDQNAEMGKTLADWGDPTLTHLPGGVALLADGQSWGGAAVGGNTTERDIELSEIVAKMLVSG